MDVLTAELAPEVVSRYRRVPRIVTKVLPLLLEPLKISISFVSNIKGHGTRG